VPAETYAVQSLERAVALLLCFSAAEPEFTIGDLARRSGLPRSTVHRLVVNLVLMLDVSGSVEERIDFIRKAARDFLRTASPQDRISIISFNEDIRVISNFTTDRTLLSKRLDELDAGACDQIFDGGGYEYFAGFGLTGAFEANDLVRLIANLPEGSTEFMCHPGFLRAELQAARTRLKQSREEELKALTDPSLRPALTAAQVQLTNFRSLGSR